MEEIKDSLPTEYKNGFNTGYQFFKEFPAIGKEAIQTYLNDVDINDSDLSQIQGLVDGLTEGNKGVEKEISIQNLNDITDLRNQQGEEKSPDLELE
jgi:hypothetical protein